MFPSKSIVQYFYYIKQKKKKKHVEIFLIYTYAYHVLLFLVRINKLVKFSQYF
jgi:hypothetical protein